MNIAIVGFGTNPVLKNAIKIFSKKLYSKGNVVKTINADLEKVPLIGYQYMIFVVDAGALFTPNKFDAFAKYLKEHENINSNYVSIYINKRFRAQTHLLRYMKLLESYGILIHSSGIIDNDDTSNQIIENLTPVKVGT